jgi:hypothetical protein
VDADLVRAARLEAQANARHHAVAPAQRLGADDVRHGALAIRALGLLVGAAADAVAAVPHQLALDALRADDALHDGHVLALRLVPLEDVVQPALGGLGAREAQHPGRLLIEPMHHEERRLLAGLSAGGAGLRHRLAQGVQHRGLLGRRVRALVVRRRCEVRRLVHDDQVRVLVQHPQLGVLVAPHARGRLAQLDGLAALHAPRRVELALAVHEHLSAGALGAHVVPRALRREATQGGRERLASDGALCGGRGLVTRVTHGSFVAAAGRPARGGPAGRRQPDDSYTSC